MDIRDFINIDCFPFIDGDQLPWDIVKNLEKIITGHIGNINADEYIINNDIVIHKSAIIEDGAVIKGPIIISANCFVAATAYLRGAVYLAENVIIGPSVEVKTSLFGPDSKAAHLNFVGDSVIGRNVNIEAGAILANYRNESDDKQVYYKEKDALSPTGVEKFGALLGDGCKIGANAVLVPGVVLGKDSQVGRLQLVDHYCLKAPAGF